MSATIKVWAKALAGAMSCVPDKIREPVLIALLKNQQVPTAENLEAVAEANSLMTQVMVCAITRNHSKEEAARILFRGHAGRGAGSHWLPDYLDGLPGITVDRTQCAAIANSAGSSHLDNGLKI